MNMENVTQFDKRGGSMVKEEISGIRASSIEIMTPEEEGTLEYIKNIWEKEARKVSIKEVFESFVREKYNYLSFEKTRNIIYDLFEKGQILIDVKGKERLCRPNHVVVFSKTRPKDFRNITILDPETEYPISRVWFSIYKEDGKIFLNITESKRLSKGWETVNNIVIPPDAVDTYVKISKYINKALEGE